MKWRKKFKEPDLGGLNNVYTDNGRVLLKAEGLTKRYTVGESRVNALIDANFEIISGEFIVVLGPSGSGKSTLLNILGGMDSPDEGTISFSGSPVNLYNEQTLSNYRQDLIGFVFQFFNLIPSLTARENVMLAAQLSRHPLDVEEILNMVELTDRGDHFPSQLSGGQQQRVAIARAVVKNPVLLLCDEPTGALDISSGMSVLSLLWRLNKQQGKTVIVITHNSAIANIADRVFTMRDGRIVNIHTNSSPSSPEEVVW